MKKIFISALALAILSTSAYAQVSSAVSTTNFNNNQVQLGQQPQPNMGSQIAPASIVLPQSATPVSTEKSKTASEQGYVVKSGEEEEYFISKKASESSARQMGIRIYPGREGNPFVKSASAKEFHNWQLMLRKAGVPPKKILFEAKRLNKEDFVVWATKQIEFYNKIEVIQ